MLMLIGPLRFKVAPFHLNETSHSYGATHVQKPVMGAQEPLEFTGKIGSSWSFRAGLFPRRFGGESSLMILKLMVDSGLPQYMLRGDGTLMGWVVIENVVERSSYLDASGVGQVIEVDISLRRAQAPTPAGYFSALSGLFGGLF